MKTFARIRDLTTGVDRTKPTALDAAMTRLATAVQPAGEQGSLLLNLGPADEAEARDRRVLSLDGTQGKPPAAEIRCAVATLWRLLEGSYSPVEAYRDGALRVRGDEKRAKRVLRHLAGPDGSVDCG